MPGSTCNFLEGLCVITEGFWIQEKERCSVNNGIWALIPYYFSPWTLRVNDLKHRVLRSSMMTLSFNNLGNSPGEKLTL